MRWVQQYIIKSRLINYRNPVSFLFLSERFKIQFNDLRPTQTKNVIYNVDLPMNWKLHRLVLNAISSLSTPSVRDCVSQFVRKTMDYSVNKYVRRKRQGKTRNLFCAWGTPVQISKSRNNFCLCSLFITCSRQRPSFEYNTSFCMQTIGNQSNHRMIKQILRLTFILFGFRFLLKFTRNI